MQFEARYTAVRAQVDGCNGLRSGSVQVSHPVHNAENSAIAEFSTLRAERDLTMSIC